MPGLATTSSPNSPSYESSKSDPGPLGLHVLYAPDHGHKADIVFVHGLGGSSRWTWSKHHKAELFWPLTFLPLEPDLCLARILSFGYNASFRKAGNVGTAVLDFAKQLLFDLKYAKDLQKAELNIGLVSSDSLRTALLILTISDTGTPSLCCSQHGRSHR